MQSVRERRIHAAENPQVVTELAGALKQRWDGEVNRGGFADASVHAPIVAGMFAAMATEEEVADYLRTVEQAARPEVSADVPFGAELLRIVLRLDEVGGRSRP